jgi:hypothetical protein
MRIEPTNKHPSLFILEDGCLRIEKDEMIIFKLLEGPEGAKLETQSDSIDIGEDFVLLFENTSFWTTPPGIPFILESFPISQTQPGLA